MVCPSALGVGGIVQPILADNHTLYPMFEIVPYGSYIQTIHTLNDIQRHKVFAQLGMRSVISPQFWKPSRLSSLMLRGYGIDNGAYSDYLSGNEFNEIAFLSLCQELGGAADWIVIPDVVGNRQATIQQAHTWINKLKQVCSTTQLLFVWQDGMTYDDLLPFVRDGIGIFIGGTTDGKLGAMRMVGDICNEYNVWSHCGRVNTVTRTAQCIDANISSCDGSGYSRFIASVQPLANYLLPKLQPQLFRKQADFSLLKTFRQRNVQYNLSIPEYDRMITIDTDYIGIRKNADTKDFEILRWKQHADATNI